ncbi:tetratricopeptide repeat protein [Actinomadura litoris]|uniref:Tetratricopeptide repeat protein n=1 Tax=Actinomadura litoris TaxID=2678616 RepID=A0A7K1KXF5_9ACTN|nr:tetratricopeptide repeat protein [Actinomadura litoris]MUN36888.1 tetratricopeptide repeat protein [Actinomadura litoris]
MANAREWGRRSLLRGAALVTGAAATAPLLGRTAAARAEDGDADALFKAGEFERAGRAYEEILKKDPKNVHAARRRGYVGLLGNKFPDAEKYLTMALGLAPADKETNRLLGDCYIRQDKFALSVPRWQAAGEDVYAKWFGAIRGEAYQVHGDVGRAAWTELDPFPILPASVNGGPQKRFTFYSRVPWLGLSAKTAKEAGLEAVASQKIEYAGREIWHYFGVLESFRLGGIELRNVPVQWTGDEEASSAAADGIIGTWILYHFLTTVDYAGRSLILRRRTPEAARKARADAGRAGADPLPMWLAREHLLHSRGSVADSGTRVVAMDVGGTGETAAGMAVETAQRLRVRTDYDRPVEAYAGGQPVISYPCYPHEIRLGDATAKHVYCYADKGGGAGGFAFAGAAGGAFASADEDPPQGEGFDVLAHFSHSFYKPYNVTLDFTGMKVYIARGKAG